MHDDPPEHGLITSHSSMSTSHSVPVSPGVQWHAVQLVSGVPPLRQNKEQPGKCVMVNVTLCLPNNQ